MSKVDFFQQLSERLKGLPQSEQEQIIRVYSDLFEQAQADGKSEQEIAESLGTAPTGEWAYPKHHEGFRLKAESGIRMLVASLALLVFNLIFVLGPAVAVIAVLFAFSLCSILLVFSPVWIVMGSGLGAVAEEWALRLFVSMAGTGAGILCTLGAGILMKGFFRFAKAYMRMNLRLIRGE